MAPQGRATYFWTRTDPSVTNEVCAPIPSRIFPSAGTLAVCTTTSVKASTAGSSACFWRLGAIFPKRSGEDESGRGDPGGTATGAGASLTAGVDEIVAGAVASARAVVATERTVADISPTSSSENALLR